MLGEYAAREGGIRIMHALKHSQLLRRKLQGRLLPACVALRSGLALGRMPYAAGCGRQSLPRLEPCLLTTNSAPALPCPHPPEFSELELTELLSQVFLEGHQGALQARQHPH